MEKKKLTSKLRLNKVTISSLTNPEMKIIAGGGDPDTFGSFKESNCGAECLTYGYCGTIT